MYKALMTSVAAVVVAGSVWMLSAVAAPSRTESLEVSRYASVTLSESRADNILNGASTLLQSKDTAADTACGVTLSRPSGSIATFALPIKITSSTSYAAACATPGRVHVVDDITYCGGSCPDCLGCSDLPGRCVTTVRHTENLESILWAHEYGHNVGNVDAGGPGSLMSGAVAAGNVAVTPAECSKFLNPASGGGQASPPGAVKPAPPSPARQPLADFIRTPFAHGVPYDQASAYGPQAVDQLITYLKDAPAGVRLSNVTLTLGMIGDTRAIGPLQQFITTGSSTVSRDVLVAKRSAIVALGYLYFKARDQNVLKFLVDGTRPGFWSERVSWRTTDDTQDRDRSLAMIAIQALGVTGSAEASATLSTPGLLSLDSEFSDVVADALRQNDQVRRLGAAAFVRPQ
jgi:hypothetical protein